MQGRVKEPTGFGVPEALWQTGDFPTASPPPQFLCAALTVLELQAALCLLLSSLVRGLKPELLPPSGGTSQCFQACQLYGLRLATLLTYLFIYKMN